MCAMHILCSNALVKSKLKTTLSLGVVFLWARGYDGAMTQIQNIAIIMPARFGSTRLPGKPLKLIAGKSMLSRVIEIAQDAAEGLPHVQVAVATDHEEIIKHAEACGAEAIMTDDTCKTGSDRVLQAALKMKTVPDIVINLQGDAPFTPADFVRSVIDVFCENSDALVATPVVNLSWEELDKLREQKKATPFSGTTCVMGKNGKAKWFSKNILPAIRKEENLRLKEEKSPVYRHIGLYGYRLDILKKFVTLPEGHFEALEGLEQLRFLENDIDIYTTVVDYEGRPAMNGVDSPEDLARAEALLKSA